MIFQIASNFTRLIKMPSQISRWHQTTLIILRSSPSIEHPADRRAYASTGIYRILHGKWALTVFEHELMRYKKQRVLKYRTKHFPCGIVSITYILSYSSFFFFINNFYCNLCSKSLKGLSRELTLLHLS